MRKFVNRPFQVLRLKALFPVGEAPDVTAQAAKKIKFDVVNILRQVCAGSPEVDEKFLYGIVGQSLIIQKLLTVGVQLPVMLVKDRGKRIPITRPECTPYFLIM